MTHTAPHTSTDTSCHMRGLNPPQPLTQVLNESIPQAQLVATPLPQCPSISLWLFDASYPQWNISYEQAAAIMNSPPFWSFCWASGQVLANYLLQNPSIVREKTVLDFGAGSGVVGIAARLAGAKQVIVCDEDPVALDACRHNAQLNGVALNYCSTLKTAGPADLITVADVFYDRDNLPLLNTMKARASQILVADSRLKGEPLDGLAIVGQRESFTVPDLAESKEFSQVNLYASPSLRDKHPCLS